MDKRINFIEKGYNALKPMFALGAYLANSPIEQVLLDLIDFRVSQINGCAYCLDMHSKDLWARGETEQRLYVLDAWREAPFYSDRERAALAWAEALTIIPNGGVTDDIYAQVRAQFSDEEIIDLTMKVLGINMWNRLNIAFGSTPGTYKVGEHARHLQLKS
ncbi:MAG TPA: carboxymuconolactone decarboxylase family protein [Candidatus Kapabacteria bacterium]|nr:carboxymuconolactone decarboxylase family protein [Candidatus Kapabacteria bacterium]